jgi:hypothetical protein
VSLIEHQKYKRFLGRTPDPPNGKEGKIRASEASQKRLEWENIIFFAA